MPRTSWKRVSTNISEDDYFMLKKLARYLYERGILPNDSISSLVKLSVSLLVVVTNVAMGKRERYARQFGELIKAALMKMKMQKY